MVLQWAFFFGSFNELLLDYYYIHIRHPIKKVFYNKAFLKNKHFLFIRHEILKHYNIKNSFFELVNI